MTNYHHGNLREALLVEARQQLIESGPEKLSLRALARSLGVSQTAPYRHFPDKTSLQVALAAEAFNRFNKQMWDEADKSESPHERMVELGLTYVNFACTNPELYKFMFGPILNEIESSPELETACMEGMGLLMDGVRSLLDTENEYILWQAAVSCRAFVHGLACIKMDGLDMECPITGRAFNLPASLHFMLAGLSGFNTDKEFL